MDEREERAKRLKRLKQKRLISVLVMIVVLAGLGGGFVLAKDYRQKKAAEEAQKAEEKNKVVTMQITEFSATDVSEIAYTNEVGAYHFVWTKNEGEAIGKWVLQGREDFPSDVLKVQTIISSFCKLTSTEKIALADADLEAYGLATPVCTAELTLSDGTVRKFKVGHAAPYSSGRYFMEEGGDAVWIVDENMYTRLCMEEVKLVEAETFPKTTEQSILEVEIKERGKEPVSYLPNVGDDDTITYPAIFSDCTKFVASTVQEFDCKDFAQYGLDDPCVTVTVHYLEKSINADGEAEPVGATMTLEIGDLTVSDNYFVRVNGSSYVYIMTNAFANKYIPQ